jgi:hypothetical protein
MTRIIRFLAFVSTIALTGCGPSNPSQKPDEQIPKAMSVNAQAWAGPSQTGISPQAQFPAHGVWDVLLQKHVSSTGKVDYKGFAADKAELEKYLNHLAKNPAREEWPRTEQMAYWINAYNAFTVKLIIDHYPVASIMKIHGGNPWDVKWIKLGGKTYTLNQIEHDILRPRFNDARIHFAVNCAAASCPPLLYRAWSAANLERYLEQQTRKFINNQKYNLLSADKVQLSKIFEWYAADFDNIIDFLNRYSDTKINPKAKVEYLEYDWGLNEGVGGSGSSSSGR